MNETLTLEYFQEICKKFNPVRREFDILLLTHKQHTEFLESNILEIRFDNDPRYYDNRIYGVPFEAFYNERDLLKRAAELISQDKKVAIIK